MKDPGNYSLDEPGTETPGSTSRTLLDRVRAGDEGSRAWLSKLYGPLIYHRYLTTVPKQDRPELVQEVLVTVFAKIGAFQKRCDGPAFRGWLYKISFHKVGDYIKRKRREARAMDRAVIPPDDDGPDDRDDVADTRILVHRALELVRPEFEPATYEAARRQLIDGQPAGLVAAEMGKTLNAIYIAKSRVLRRVRDILEELGELSGGSDPDAGPPGGEP